MYPNIDLGMIKLNTFPIVLILAIFSCVLLYMYSIKYDLFYFYQIKWSSVYCMVGAGVIGKVVYFFTRGNSPNLVVFDRLGGFVFYGGLIGAIVGLYIYSKQRWNRFLDLLDTYASIFPLGQAIGRIGCYFNGCCYGKYYTGFLSVKYVVDGKETHVFPTWFIESFFCFVLFICMFLISKKIYSGIYAAIYMMSYSLFRFVIEYFRGDLVRGVWHGVSTSQYISICIFVVGVVTLIKSIQIKENNLLITGRRRKKDANEYVSK